jgi:hypothetical protein
MQLAERKIIKFTEHRFVEIEGLAFQSQNLYNAANYVIRQSFIYGVIFSGKRIKRGLYRTSVGQLINSDVNASYNILRKAFPLCA